MLKLSQSIKVMFKTIFANNVIDSDTSEYNARSEINQQLRLLEKEGVNGFAARIQGGNNISASTKFRSEVLRRNNISLNGKVLDLGIGHGLSIKPWRDLMPNSSHYIGLELNNAYIKSVIPKVIDQFYPQKNDQKNITIMEGSFNEIPLPDSSIDYIVEENAFHHSNDLNATLKECVRVIKPGGKMILIDRFHKSSTSQKSIDYLLDLRNPISFWKLQGLEKAKSLTRREMGEHEIRVSEWKQSFMDATTASKKISNILFQSYRIISQRLYQITKSIYGHDWDTRQANDHYPRILDADKEVLDLCESFGRMSTAPWLNYNGEIYHTALECSNDPDIRKSTWMGRSVIIVTLEK